MKHVVPILSLTAVCALSPACSTDFKLPSEAQVGCATTADCPSGWACNEKVGRCVKTENIDSEAPALVGEVTVAPSMLKKGAKATVTFEISEELSKPPVVTVNAGADRLLSLGEKASSGNKYVFTYAAAGDEPQGVESAISIVLTDKSGNESGKLSGKSLKFDFMAPKVTDPVVDGSPVKKDGGATVTFSVSEPLKSDPVVTLASGEKLAKDKTSKPPKYVYAYAATGTESQDPAGVAVAVDLEDTAGNAAKEALDAALRFDFAAPALSGTPVVAPQIAKAGMIVTVVFATSEELGALPVVLAGGAELTGRELPGNNFKFGYKVEAADADGKKPITISLTDKAKNMLENAPGGSFSVDSTVPQVQNVATPGRKFSAVAGSDEVMLTFDASEDVGSGLSATIGGLSMACGAWQAAAPSYTCTHTVTLDEGAGAKDISISALDAAGNVGFGSANVEYDFSGPTLTLSVQPAGRPARLGELVTVGIASSEALSPSGIALDSGGLALGAPSGSGTSYTWTYTVKDTDSGSYNLSATAADVVGNPAAAPATATLALDGIAPAIGSVTADKARYSRVSGYDVVTARFDCTEDVGTGLTVTVGGAAMSCGAWSSNSPSYTCTYAVQAGDTGGVKPIEVKATDAAGNSTYGSGSVEYDFTAPAVISARPGQDAYKLNDSVLYTVNVSEPLAGNSARPAVRVFKDAVGQQNFFGDPVSETDTSFTYTRPVAAGMDGSYTVTVDVTDKAGNAVAGLGGTGWNVDAAAPTVAPVSLATNNPNFNTLAKEGDVVTAVFDVNEALAADPAVAIGGRSMGFVSKTGSGPYRYTYTRMVLAGDGDGMKSASVTATDAAGNVKVQDIGGVTYDFTPPGASLDAAPASAKVGTTVRVTLTGTEALAGPPPIEAKNGPDTVALVAQDLTPWKPSYAYAYTVSGVTAQGSYTIQPFSVTDQAGNSRLVTPSPAVTFAVDSSIPAIVTGPTLNKNPASYKAGDVISLAFTTSEDLDARLPKVTLNTSAGKDLPCVAGAGVNDYTCSLPAALAGTESPQGLTGISIELADPAGNSGFASTTVTLDFTPPSVISARPGQVSYKLNDAILYTVNVGEPLAGSPGRPAVSVKKSGVVQPGFFGAPVTETDTSFTYSAAVAGGMDGSYTVEVGLTDKAGNAATSLAGDPFAVDATPPAVTPVSVTTSNATNTLAKDGDVVTAVFDVNEVLAANPTVTIGGQAMDYGTKTGAGPYRYTYARATVTGDGDGMKSVSVTATDTAGNVKVEDIGGVTYDFTPPAVVGGSASVQFFPDYPATNPLSVVTAATNGTKVRVTFATSEAVTPAPKVVMFKTADLDPAQVIELALKTQAGTLYSYEEAVTGIAPGLEFADKIQIAQAPAMADLAGNTPATALDITTFTMDTQVPVAPDTLSADKIVYKRVPWGSDATAGAKRFTVQGAAGALPADAAAVMIYDSATPGPGALIGTQTRRIDNGFDEQTLNGSDRVKVYAASADPAGNLSATAEVNDAEWTATMGNKVPGSMFENPHVFTSTPVFSNWLAQNDDIDREPTTEDLAKVGRVDSDSMIQAAEGTWLELNRDANKPVERALHTMVYDNARGLVVLFGGWDLGMVQMQDIWEWDGATGTWIERTSAGLKPNGRNKHAMVYDSVRGKVVMYGGWTGTTTDDMWEWDGATGTWTELTPVGMTPGARYGHSMVYDSARGRAVLFGGYYNGSPRQDIWEWDGATGTWIERTSAGLKPGPRAYHGMAYDTARQRVVLFGGWDAVSLKQDIWEWDGATGTWTERAPPGPTPEPREVHSMVYDSARGRAVLFGGYYNGSPQQDIWEWDGAAGTWTELSPVGVKPSARSGHAMVYDSGRSRLLVFGGSDGFLKQDTWEWESAASRWTERTPLGIKPGVRYGHAMVYDNARDRVVLFGGIDGYVYKQDTWEWDGARGTWTERAPAGSKPGVRYGHSMVYDSAHNRVVLFGGWDGGSYLQDTWEWDGAGGTWTELAPGTKPSVRSQFTMAYDSVRQRVVLFGGYDGAFSGKEDTWEWDGAAGTWTERTPVGAKPSARYDHAMVYDGTRERVMLFGGFDGMYKQDSWEWDGAAGTWAERTPIGTKPGDRGGHAMAYDPVRQRVILFGGWMGAFDGQDTWEWDGASGAWTEVTPSGIRPAARRSHALAYDNARGRMLLFDGWSSGFKQDTWEWDGAANYRPGQLLRPVFVVAGVDESILESVAVLVHSGGVGYPAGVATNGVDLKVWDEGMWKVVATNNSPPGSPSLVSWTTTDPQVIPRLFFGDQQTLNFAVTPVAPNGTGTGEVSVDYAEVTVKYRMP